MPLESDPMLAPQALGAPAAAPHSINRPSPLEGITKKARRLALALGLLSAAPGCDRAVNDAIQNFIEQEGIEKRGVVVANQAIQEAPQKRGIRVKTADGVDLGLLSGADARTNPTLRGIDGSIPVPPEAFEKINGKQGPLYWYYRAYIELEDRELDPLYCKAPNCDPQSARRGVNSQAWKRWLEGKGGSGGGDQTCGAMRAGFKEQKLPEARKFWLAKDWMKRGAKLYSIKSGKALKTSENALVYKMEDFACGIGLAKKTDNSNKKLTAPQIMALNATYAYLAPDAEGVERFVRLYWGFSGINDPRLDTGHQMVLAALHNLPWDSTETRWSEIEERASIPDTNLYRQDVIGKKDYASVLGQIKNAKPLPKQQQNKSSVSLSSEFRGPLLQAVKELVAIEGEDFRGDVVEMVLTVREKLQRAAKKAADSMVGKVGPQSHPIIVVEGPDGSVWADYTDDEFIQRKKTLRNPGSMGKPLLAAGVAKLENEAVTSPLTLITGETLLVDPRVAFLDSFRRHLTLSQREIIDDARNLGVDHKFIRELMSCYGTPPPAYLNKENVNELDFAALGNWNVSPESMLDLMHAAYTGQALGESHTLDSYTTRDGKVHKIQPKNPSAKAIECAQKMGQGGKTAPMLKWPLEMAKSELGEKPKPGTAIALQGKVDGAKTGTACVTDSHSRDQTCLKGNKNNAACVVAVKGDATFIACEAADKPTKSINLGGKKERTLSIDLAVPMGVIMADALSK